jgi:hypothetical protein
MPTPSRCFAAVVGLLLRPRKQASSARGNKNLSKIAKDAKKRVLFALLAIFA